MALLAAGLAALTLACKQPTSPGSRGGGETPEEESITKGISSLASLSITCEGFPEDISQNVYPDLKTFTGTQKYYLVPYPLGSAGQIKITFTRKADSALSAVLLDGFDLPADEPAANETDGGVPDEEEEPADEDDTPHAVTYTVQVLASDSAHKVEISLSNMDYGERITYTLNINGVNATGGGMKAVSIPASGAITIPADILTDAYFAHIHFAGINRLKKLLLSELSGGAVVDVFLEGGAANPSKWQLQGDGSITVTQGTPKIDTIYVGPKYYYDYLYSTDVVESELRGLITSLSQDLGLLRTQVEGLGGGQAGLAESLLDEVATINPPVSGAGTSTYTITGAADYDFAYIMLSGGDIWHTVSFANAPVAITTGVTVAIAGGTVTVTMPDTMELERIFFGTGEAVYHTLASLEAQLTALSGVLAGEYATLEALEEAIEDSAANTFDNIADAIASIITINETLGDAADAILGGTPFESLPTAAAKITTVQAALSQVLDSHSLAIATITNALGILNAGEYSGSLNAYVNTINPIQQPHSVSFAFAAGADGRPDGETNGHFTSRLGNYDGAGSYNAHQTFIPEGSFKRYERYTTIGGSWTAWQRTDTAFIAVRNVGSFSGSLNTFIAGKQQPANSTYFGYATGTTGVGKPAANETAGFFTSETGDSLNGLHQTFRPAGSNRVYERQTSTGEGSWGGVPDNGWTRTDAEFIAENLHTQDVGEITAGNCANGLDDFVTHFEQPAGSVYTGYAAAGVTGKPDGAAGAVGFFTSYLASVTSGTEYVSRQTFRQDNTAFVYERSRSGSPWGAWTRTDAAALNVRNVGSFSTSLTTFAADKNQPPNSVYFGYAAAGSASSSKPAGTDSTAAGFFTSEVGDTDTIHQTFRPAGTSRIWERSTTTGTLSSWARTDAEFAATSLNVRNVGNITTGSLNSFVTMAGIHSPSAQQASYSTCYAFIDASVTDKPEASAGFFTSYLGAYTDPYHYVSRQEFRPTGSNNVYERNGTGNADWNSWVQTNSPATTTPIARTITANTNFVSFLGTMQAVFANGFMTVSVSNAELSGSVGDGNILYTIQNTKLTGLGLVSFLVIFYDGSIRWCYMENEGNNIRIKAVALATPQAPFPTSTRFGFTVTVPAQLVP